MQFKALVILSIIFSTTSCSILKPDSCSEEVALEKGTRLIYEKYPDHINDPNPIEIYEYKGLWRIHGTLPPKVAGGTPNVKLDRKSCKLVDIYHTQ